MINKIIYISLMLIMDISTFSVVMLNKDSNNTVTTSGIVLSNNKIGWGIKRAGNHEQPYLGSKNKELLDKYDGIAMENSEDKFVYLTFDEGYEAGYTEKILNVLKKQCVSSLFYNSPLCKYSIRSAKTNDFRRLHCGQLLLVSWMDL